MKKLLMTAASLVMVVAGCAHAPTVSAEFHTASYGHVSYGPVSYGIEPVPAALVTPAALPGIPEQIIGDERAWLVLNGAS